jgi:hypothetical protein
MARYATTLAGPGDEAPGFAGSGVVWFTRTLGEQDGEGEPLDQIEAVDAGEQNER